MKISRILGLRIPLAVLLLAAAPAFVCAAPLVPGTGTKAEQVGDDFEEEDWDFVHNFPKSSEEEDGAMRHPTGYSKNGRWYEGIKRGQPDYLKRVETPPGGLEGSTHSLLMRTLYSGIPGRLSGRIMQDDFICNVDGRLGGAIPVSQQPSVVVRVFFPEEDQWEPVSGPSFAFRAACSTTINKSEQTGGLFSRTVSRRAKEVYWPGLWVYHEREADGYAEDKVYLRIRGNASGRDYTGPTITERGWWTLGMSFTPDGMVHYYASPGVDDLTEDDYLDSQYPYSYRCEHLKTLFFNVLNKDNGQSWSTPWIIDDPSVYFVPTR